MKLLKKIVTPDGEYTLTFDNPEQYLSKVPRLPKEGECILVEERKKRELSGWGYTIMVYLCNEGDKKEEKKRTRRKRRSRRK